MRTKPSFRSREELDQHVGGTSGVFEEHLLKSRGGPGSSIEQRAIKTFQFRSLFLRETGASESDGIETAEFVEPGPYRVRGQIHTESGSSLSHRQCSDPDELVHGAVTRQNRSITDRDVPSQQRSIGHDHMIADMTVVSHMTMRHEIITRSNGRVFLEAVRTMHRGMFAEHIVVSNHKAGRSIRIF